MGRKKRIIRTASEAKELVIQPCLFKSSKHRLTPAQKSLLRRCTAATDGVLLYDLATALRRTAVVLTREGLTILRVWLTLESQEPRTLDFASFPTEEPIGRWGLKPADARLVAIAWKIEVQLA